jgi:hypothetical protein
VRRPRARSGAKVLFAGAVGLPSALRCTPHSTALRRTTFGPGGEVLRPRVPAGDAPSLWCFSVGGLSHPERTWFRRWLAGSELPKIEQRFPGGRRPRDHRMFAGIVDLRQVPFWGRLFFRAAGGRSGDQRDWPAVEAWATEIANRLDALRAPAESDRR